MEIKAILAEALNCIKRAMNLSSPKNEIEIAALRWNFTHHYKIFLMLLPC